MVPEVVIDTERHKVFAYNSHKPLSYVLLAIYITLVQVCQDSYLKSVNSIGKLRLVQSSLGVSTLTTFASNPLIVTFYEYNNIPTVMENVSNVMGSTINVTNKSCSYVMG